MKKPTSGDQAFHERESDRLYDQYGKPLEALHSGEFVAIAPDGRVFLGNTMVDAAKLAKDAFGPGVYLFKVGERAVGRWR